MELDIALGNASRKYDHDNMSIGSPTVATALTATMNSPSMRVLGGGAEATSKGMIGGDKAEGRT